MLNASKTLLGLAALLSLLAGACSGLTAATPVEPSRQPNVDSRGEVGPVNRIAYVNLNGDLFTVDPDGSGLSQLTGGFQAGGGSEGGIQAQPLHMNEYYTWPTWSADGTKLAASRVVVKTSGTDVTLQVMDARTGRSETVYEDDGGALVAEGAPHYI